MDAGAAGRRDQEDTLIGPRDEREDVKASCKPMNIREAYELCTESTLTCLDAKLAIITQPPTVQQDLIVALCQQKVLKEKKFFGMTASLPNCMQGVSLWPLFGLSPPNLLLLSPSGNYYACVCEASPPPASKSPSKGASSSSPSSSSTPEYKVVLYGRTAAHIGGVVGVCTPKGSMPWHGSIGGGEFCPSQENLFVYVGEACTEDKKRRAKSLLAESLEEGKKKKAHAGEEQQEDDKLHKSKKKEEKEGDRHTQDSDGDEDQEEKEEINKFDESLDAFVYKTDMGEQLQGHREGRLFLTNFHRRTTHMLQPPNPNYSCGQPRWIPDGSGIACTILGLIYCINRRSRVYLAQQFGKKEEKEREGHEEEERKREDGEEQEEGIGEKKQEEEGEEEKHCKRKNRHDKKKDKKKKKSDLSCDWLQISKEEEDFAAFSPVWRDNLPRETKTTRRRGREGEQGREEEEGNVARVAYLSLRKH
ncbi:acylaminoacyl, partial [Cystoisospora suis]